MREPLFERVVNGVMCLVVVFALLVVLLVPIAFASTIVIAIRRPYHLGDVVKIKELGVRASVTAKDVNKVTVSYPDALGRMTESKLLYEQVEPWEGK